jgi:cohesin complex subunit SCC1
MNRKNILSIDVAKTCEEILKPHLPMALRLSSILLAGSALALNRQYQLLLDDCRLFLSSLNHSRYAMEEITLKPGTKRYVLTDRPTPPSYGELCSQSTLEPLRWER